MDKRLRAYLDLSLAMMIVGSSVIAGKMLVASFPVFLGAGLRFALASLIAVPLLLYREKGLPRFSRKDWFYLFLQAFSGVFLFSVFLLNGLKFTSAAESGIITSTTPAVLGVISFLFLGERMNWNKCAGIGLSLAGILAINVLTPAGAEGRGANPLLGNALVFAAVVGEALFTVFRKLISDEITPLATMTVMSVGGLILFLPFALNDLRSFSFSGVSDWDWLPAIYYGIVVTVIGFMLWFRGVAQVSAGTAAVFTGVCPLSALLFSYLLLGEKFVPAHLLGFACVLLGVLLIARQPGESPNLAVPEQC